MAISKYPEEIKTTPKVSGSRSGLPRFRTRSLSRRVKALPVLQPFPLQEQGPCELRTPRTRSGNLPGTGFLQTQSHREV